MSLRIHTHLISGAGNTFHIAFLDGDQKGTLFAGALVKRMCMLNPADGIIFLEKKNAGEFTWQFFNNDGSFAEMCGNATRCVGFYIKNVLKENLQKFVLQTIAGPIQVETLSSSQFKVTMTPFKRLQAESYFFCNTGVPHIVIPVSSMEEARKNKIKWSELRHSPIFGERGTNVTLVVLSEKQDQMKAISYERGVEDFTMACGTGAAAAALYNLDKNQITKTSIEMPGGTIMMDLSDEKYPQMIGGAELLGEFNYEIED